MKMKSLFGSVLAGLLLCLLGPAPGSWAQSSAGSPVDPVVADVVRMIDVGVEPELVLQWLESSGRRPAPLSADDVIALSQAQVPREVIQALLDLASQPAPPTAAPRPAAPVYATPSPSTPGYRPDRTAAPQTTPPGECCLVEVSVEYRAPAIIEGDNTAQPNPYLFIYVDGNFLARVEPAGNIAAQGPVRIKTQLEPGPHRIRLTRELHLKSDALGKNPAWDHETTVNPLAVDLQVEAGGNYNLDIRWVQGEFSLKKPFSWRWSRNGAEIAAEKNVGEFLNKWAFLCEDVEVSRDNGAISDWRARDRLKDCVRWPDLWGTDTPTREQVLADLQQHDFDPPVSYVGRLN